MSEIRKINKTEETDSKVKETTVTLDKPKNKKVTQNINEAMEAVRRDYKLKDSNSPFLRSVPISNH
jgi:hypothetical protein